MVNFRIASAVGAIDHVSDYAGAISRVQ